ncbi:MAG TPA: hypothetical protein VGG37_05755 [Opitutaceae bacterium]
MNLPSDTPRLPKWVFVAGYVALLVTAWLISDNAAHPTAGLALISIVVCVALAAVLIAVPFVADYANRQDEALDNRQRSLQALSVTVASAAEQVSIAATGLQGIAEAAQENFSKFERLSKGIEAKITELDSRLASTKRDDGEAAARYETAAKKAAKSAAEFEAAAAKAAAAVEAARAAAAAAAHPPEVPPVIASRIAEIKPAVRSSDHPFDESGGASGTPPGEPASEPAPAPAPLEGAPPQAEAEPAATPPPPPPRKRSPRKAPAAPVPEPAADPVPEELVQAPLAEVSEPAVSADGATRIVVTAYIGIGNRLFIRGEGPGLSWEKGVPLSFVSIGKWRWETNEASAAVRFKLFKNDEAECSALGERSIDPGAQQELTASF